MSHVQTPPHAVIDVRSIAPRERHALIFATFAGLQPGQALQLVNDHDPQPLYHSLQSQFPDGFDWHYLEHGPDTWQVAITRRAASGCCGSCGGGRH